MSKVDTTVTFAHISDTCPSELAQASRSQLVDAVRGLAIILVALGHTNQGIIHRNWWGSSTLGGEIDGFIYSFHMPAFFFVSGIFLKASIAKRGVARFLRERFFSLLWPYLLWSCVTAVALIPLVHFTSQGTYTLQQFAWFLLTGRVSWFLPSVFFALLLASLAVRVHIGLTLVISVALAALPLQTQLVFVAKGLHFLPFLVLGMFVGSRIARLNRVPVVLAALLFSMLGTILWISTCYVSQQSTAEYLLTGMAGTSMLFLLARCLQSTSAAQWLAWVGAASLAIFLLSEFPQGFGRVILVSAFHSTQPSTQILFPTVLAVVLPAWLYHRRYALKIKWMFEAPFAIAPRLR